MPDSSDVSKYYNEFSQSVLVRDFSRRNLRQVALKRLCGMFVKKGGRVLEIGCGVGILTRYLSKRTSEVVSIDISPENVDVARRYVKSENVHFYVLDVCNDISQLQVYAPFDNIILPDVIEHIPREKHAALLRQLLNLLRKDSGLILLTYPNPAYQHYLKKESPGAMQIVDEIINLRDILDLTNLRPIYYVLEDVWLQKQYAHLVMTSDSKYKCIESDLSLLNKLSRKIAYYLWYVRNYRFVKRL